MKQNLSTACIWRIRRMIKAILANPQDYNQEHFPYAESREVCGSTGCAAGHAVKLDNPQKFRELVSGRTRVSEWWDEAAKALLLPPQVDVRSLFGMSMDWPEKFWNQYLTARDAQGKAEACQARWEHFIATDGKE